MILDVSRASPFKQKNPKQCFSLDKDKEIITLMFSFICMNEYLSTITIKLYKTDG